VKTNLNNQNQGLDYFRNIIEASKSSETEKVVKTEHSEISSNYNSNIKVNFNDVVLPYIPIRSKINNELTGKYISKAEKFKHLAKNYNYPALLTK